MKKKLDVEEIGRLYWDEKRSIGNVAEFYEVSKQTILVFMRQNNIARRSRHDPIYYENRYHNTKKENKMSEQMSVVSEPTLLAQPTTTRGKTIDKLEELKDDRYHAVLDSVIDELESLSSGRGTLQNELMRLNDALTEGQRIVRDANIFKVSLKEKQKNTNANHMIDINEIKEQIAKLDIDISKALIAKKFALQYKPMLDFIDALPDKSMNEIKAYLQDFLGVYKPLVEDILK